MNEQVRQFCEWYGDGSDGTCPTPVQWERVLSQPADQPITLINFFKLRGTAQYPAECPDFDTSVSGHDAFSRYAAVSIPTMERVGGKFLHVGPFAGAFLGPEEDWDVVAVGAYPNVASLVDLYSDEQYRKAFAHRTAACARQKVLVAIS